MSRPVEALPSRWSRILSRRKIRGSGALGGGGVRAPLSTLGQALPLLCQRLVGWGQSPYLGFR